MRYQTLLINHQTIGKKKILNSQSGGAKRRLKICLRFSKKTGDYQMF